MVRFFRRGFTLVTGALVVLIALTAASPLDLDNNDLAAVRVVHTGKFVGSKCSVDTDCYSRNCVLTNGTSTKRCQRQPAGGPCFKDSNCVSRNCDQSSKTCSAKSGIGGQCSYFGDCDFERYDFQSDCSDGVCKYFPGAGPCSNDNQCTINSCQQRQCKYPPRPPNSGCFQDSECLSGSSCSNPTTTCTAPDGSFVNCPDAVYTPSYCSRYDLGHSCANDGECSQGFCKDGVCSKSTPGDTCREAYQCTDGLLCGMQGTCYTPMNGTVYPLQQCSDDAQCVSGRCLEDNYVSYHDDNGIPTGVSVVTYTTICDYLNNGQPGCRTYRDCATGLCKDGTCAAGTDGDHCVASSQCEDVCSSEGLCETPASNSLASGQLCSEDDQCITKACNSYKYVSRPTLDDPSVSVAEQDKVCGQSNDGGACLTQSDCQTGACLSTKDSSSSGKTCQLQDLGGQCSADSQCTTGACDPKTGTCGKVGAYGGCSSDSDCYSGSCEEGPCEYYNCRPVHICAAVPTNGQCRGDIDCEGGETCDDTTSTCLVRDNFTCREDGQCQSGYCMPLNNPYFSNDGQCAPKPSTAQSSTITITPASTTAAITITTTNTTNTATAPTTSTTSSTSPTTTASSTDLTTNTTTSTTETLPKSATKTESKSEAASTTGTTTESAQPTTKVFSRWQAKF